MTDSSTTTWATETAISSLHGASVETSTLRAGRTHVAMADISLDDMDDMDVTKLPAFHSAEEILAHPRFPAARAEFVKAMLALYEHKPFLDRLLLEAGRTVLFNAIMCLYARYDEADRATWPTLRLVADVMAAHRLASPGRVQALVARLVTTGYVEQRAAARDRRVRILTPTRKMVAQDQDFLVSHHLPLQTLFPKPGYAPIMRREPVFHLQQRRAARDLFALGARILAGNPAMMLFQSRDAGIMILIKMIQMAGQKRSAGLLGISYSDLGGRFGVSRTHVRNLLVAAQAMDLLRLTKADGQCVDLKPTLLQAFDRLVADAMSSFDLCYQLALRTDGARSRSASATRMSEECVMRHIAAA